MRSSLRSEFPQRPGHGDAWSQFHCHRLQRVALAFGLTGGRSQWRKPNAPLTSATSRTESQQHHGEAHSLWSGGNGTLAKSPAVHRHPRHLPATAELKKPQPLPPQGCFQLYGVIKAISELTSTQERFFRCLKITSDRWCHPGRGWESENYVTGDETQRKRKEFKGKIKEGAKPDAERVNNLNSQPAQPQLVPPLIRTPPWVTMSPCLPRELSPCHSPGDR